LKQSLDYVYSLRKEVKVKNKIVVVTGASSGIGLATAKLLTERGAKLALISRSKAKLEALSKELPESIAIPADMTKSNEIKRMVQQAMDHFGRIDILVNNAGQGYYSSLEKTDLDIFHHIFETCAGRSQPDRARRAKE
jgi:short-subunit dehydrogenase